MSTFTPMLGAKVTTNTLDSQACNCFDWRDIPLWDLPQFVGITVAREAAVIYYKTMPVHLPMNKFYQLKTFLTVDHLHLGITPAHHLRILDLRINPGSTLELNGDDKKPKRISEQAFAVIKENVKALRLLGNKNGFILAFTIHAKGVQLDNVLDILRAICVELKDAGVRILMYAEDSEANRVLDNDDIGWLIVLSHVNSQESDKSVYEGTISDTSHLGSESEDDGLGMTPWLTFVAKWFRSRL